MQENEIGAEGARSIAEALHHNCTLHTLNLAVREAWKRRKMALEAAGMGRTGRDAGGGGMVLRREWNDEKRGV